MIYQEQTPHNDKTNMVFMTTLEIKGQLFTDQTGWFPVKSKCHNICIVIFYAVNTNCIKSYPVKLRHHYACSYNSEATNPNCNILTTKHQTRWKNSLSRTIQNSSTLHQTIIALIHLNIQFKTRRISLWQYEPEFQRLSNYPTGTQTWNKPTSCSTCLVYAHYKPIFYQPMKPWKACSHSAELQWHQ
ncbi:hypothetical protein ACHAW6_005606 [Cyclotella cf. meneghiniana]